MSACDDTFSRSERMLLALLRGALWGHGLPAELFGGADEVLWREVAALSSAQGVQALALGSVMALPVALQPPRGIKIAWALNTGNIERRSARQKEVAEGMASLLGGSGIRMLVLKGVGFARFYPEPLRRESGDVDVYLFGRHDEGERLLLDAGAVLTQERHHKHSGLCYRGVAVENHAHLLDVDFYAEDRIMEERLLGILAADEMLRNAPAGGVLFPPSGFDALFLMRHAIAHFVFGEFVLRHACDWAMFLSANRGRIDFDAYREVMDSIGHSRVADMVTALTVEHLGLDASLAPPFTAGKGDADEMLRMALAPRTTIPEGASQLKVLYFKIKRMADYRRRYNMVYRHGFGRYITRSIRDHIVDPQKILRK